MVLSVQGRWVHQRHYRNYQLTWRRRFGSLLPPVSSVDYLLQISIINPSFFISLHAFISISTSGTSVIFHFLPISPGLALPGLRFIQHISIGFYRHESCPGRGAARRGRTGCPFPEWPPASFLSRKPAEFSISCFISQSNRTATNNLCFLYFGIK